MFVDRRSDERHAAGLICNYSGQHASEADLPTTDVPPLLNMGQVSAGRVDVEFWHSFGWGNPQSVGHEDAGRNSIPDFPGIQPGLAAPEFWNELEWLMNTSNSTANQFLT